MTLPKAIAYLLVVVAALLVVWFLLFLAFGVGDGSDAELQGLASLGSATRAG
jgi:hypothetical protein